jgi:hypothetical protein
MLLHELFDISPTQNSLELFEAINSIKEIDADLFKILKQNVSYNRERSYGNSGKPSYTQNIDKKLPPYLGADSKVETYTVKSASEVTKMIRDVEHAKGMILEIGGKQALVIVKAPGEEYSSKPIYFVLGKFENMFGENYGPQELEKLDAIGINDMKQRQVSESKLYPLFTGLMKIFKEKGITDVEVNVIMKDEEREKKHISRDNARFIPKDIRHLVQPYIMANSKDIAKWENNAKDYLNVRLSTFKDHKAAHVNTPEELIKVLHTEGFMDKIRINGLPYERSNDNLSMNKLLYPKGDSESTWDRAYIQYQGVGFGNKEWEEYYTNLSVLRKSFSQILDTDEEISNAMADYRAPETISVFLRLKGNALIVDSVDIKTFSTKIKDVINLKK